MEQVSHFKYLGLTLDNKLTFDQHITYVIRKLHALSVAPHLLSLLYSSIIQPILLYCSPCFYNMLSTSNRNKLTKIKHTTVETTKIIHHPTHNLTDLNLKAVTSLAYSIIRDHTYPLHSHFTLLPVNRFRRIIHLFWDKIPQQTLNNSKVCNHCKQLEQSACALCRFIDF